VEGPFTADVALPAEPITDPQVEAVSTEFVGRWNRLISTTNWEKGRIICEWRAALIEAGAPQAAYTDEAWSRTAGNVTPQHTGRLRRVYQRFSTVQEQYAGLFWSHFQAALDWDEAEMWLEGAVQNGWSIAEMQAQRARTLGMLPPLPAEPPVELDEDAPPPAAGAPAGGSPESISGSLAEVHGADAALDGSFDGSPAELPPDDLPGEIAGGSTAAEQSPPPLGLLEHLPPLPADLAEAFEAFKLAIVRHRLAGWQEIRQADLLAALDALRQLALAPADG
jgi:hypothetical protein